MLNLSSGHKVTKPAASEDAHLLDLEVVIQLS